MDRSIPMFNRVIIEKMQRKQLDMHHQRIERIKTNPIRRQQAYSIFKTDNAKERRTQIEKQNVILFNKMSRIMNRSHTKVNWSISQHRDTKHREVNERIYEENKAIVQRIGNQRPTISAKKLYQDRQKHERLLKFMGKYPYRTNYVHKADFQEQSFDKGNSYYADIDAYTQNPSENQLQNSSFNKPRTASNTVNRQQAREITRQTTEYQQRTTHESDREQSHRIPLYKKRKQINNTMYQAEVNRLYKQYEFRLIDLISKKQYIFYMPEKEGNQLLSQSDYDYSYITSCFRVVGNKLVLDLNKPKDLAKERQPCAEMNKGSGERKYNLLNQNKHKNFRLKEQFADNEADRTEIRKQTEVNNQALFCSEDLGTFHQPDTLEPITREPSQDRARILYEEALDQEIQQM